MASSIPPTYQNGAGSANGNGAATARVYQFDPESSPQEKAAVAAKAADQLKPVAGVTRPGDFEAKGVFKCLVYLHESVRRSP